MYTYFPRHLKCVITLPCEALKLQLLQISVASLCVRPQNSYCQLCDYLKAETSDMNSSDYMIWKNIATTIRRGSKMSLNWSSDWFRYSMDCNTMPVFEFSVKRAIICEFVFVICVCAVDFLFQFYQIDGLQWALVAKVIATFWQWWSRLLHKLNEICRQIIVLNVVALSAQNVIFHCHICGMHHLNQSLNVVKYFKVSSNSMLILMLEVKARQLLWIFEFYKLL